MCPKFNCLIVVLVLLHCTGIKTYAQTDTLPKIAKVDPPLHNFYSKLVYCYGIPIRSAQVVNDSALLVAYMQMHLMLQDVPSIQRRLIRRGAELHIIGKDQVTSDLPEYLSAKGVKYIDRGNLTDVDARTRGLGGVMASCGEENLLNLLSDRYYGYIICFHEFAHTIMYFGLDSASRHKIYRQYLKAISKGLWAGAYASTDAGEYFAELSAWYFGSHGQFLGGTELPEPGSEGLRKYDPEGYALVNDIYNHGKPIIPRVPDRVQALQVASDTRSHFPTAKKTTRPCTLTMINNTDKDVTAYWVDFDGKATAYALVKPHTSYSQLTYVGHVWMLADQQHTFGYYEARGPYCEIALGGVMVKGKSKQ
jgi:hypothetical protein